MMEVLKKLFEAYYEKADQVNRDAPRFAGFWGMGDDPRRHHCHDQFYEDVQRWVLEFLNTQPEGADVLKAARYILDAAAEKRDTAAYWYAFAVHSHVTPMIDWMSPAQCRELADWYDTRYTKLERLPAQRDMYKKLRKRAKG